MKSLIIMAFVLVGFTAHAGIELKTLISDKMSRSKVCDFAKQEMMEILKNEIAKTGKADKLSAELGLCVFNFETHDYEVSGKLYELGSW